MITGPETLVAVLIASLVGSLHCAGMCGGLVLFATNSDGTLRKSRGLHLAYHGGRAVSYTALGLIAGALGAAANITNLIDGNAQTAAVIAGSAMILIGLAALAQHLGARVPHAGPPRGIQKITESAHRAAMKLPPVSRALTVGGLTPMLPCGWLYAFVIVAAGTGNALSGALVMLAFWLGTVPVLTAVGVGINAIAGPIRKRLPVIANVLVIGLGVMTALGRTSVPDHIAPPIEARATDSSAEARLQAVRNLGESDLPCCALTGEPLEPDEAGG